MKEIILIGAGGHCRSCIDVIEQQGKYKIAGLIDADDRVGEMVLGYKIIGSDKDLPEVIKKYKYFLITIGQIKTPAPRVKAYLNIKSLGGELPVIISPRAYVSPHATIGEGTIVMHDALINVGVSIGTNCIINNKALCEHDSKIADHCHISTATVVNGDCVVGSNTFIGSNTTLKQGVRVPEGSLVTYGIKYE